YRYYSGRSMKLREGAWGIIRVHDAEASLKRLPGTEPGSASTTICPPSAPRKEFAVSAMEAPWPILAGTPGKLYVLREDTAAIRSGRKAPEPLVLRVNIEDCVVIDLANETSGPVSFDGGMLAHDPRDRVATAPDQRRSYTYYAHPELGEAAVLVRDTANVLENPRLGLYAAIIVGPPAATSPHPLTSLHMSTKA